jgi:glycosyltransferase involved in cell wall biosynthesis
MSGLPRVALRVLRTEGPAAALDRAWDRWQEARRRRAFSAAPGVPAGFRAAVLNLAPTPPAPRLGGVQGQLRRRLTAEGRLRAIALLVPEGPEERVGSAVRQERAAGAEGYRLELESGGERFGIHWPAAGRRRADTPSSGPEQRSAALAHAVAAAARAVGAAAVHVEGLAGLPLAALASLRREGLELVISVHDFAAFCLRPHLLEAGVPPRFCHFSRDPRRCLSCLRHDWPEVGEDFQARRRELAGELLRGAAAVVYPSDYLRRAHRELFPGLDPARQRVIAPAAALGGDGASARQPAGGSPRRPLRHAAFIGSVNSYKGAEVFAAAVERLAGSAPALRFSVFGGGEPSLLREMRRLPRVRVRGYYREGSLPRRLAEGRVELALLLSIVPESYGLTLDECAAAGVPAVAFAHGALGERLTAAGGLLLPPPTEVETGAAALAALLARLASGEQALPSPPPRGLGTSPRDAAAAWGGLYAELGLLPRR